MGDDRTTRRLRTWFRLPETSPRRNANIRRQVAPVVAQALADVDLHLAEWHVLALSGKQLPETLLGAL
jgi:hypothetical protein